MSVVLELNGIHKSFKAGAVLSDISLQLHPGEILSIVGENGAGKSTLGKIIAGHLTVDKGTIKFAGKERVFSKPADALEAGIVLVH
jgi:ribose transport system ATP-binding protein